MKKQSPKLESTWKTKQNRPFSKISTFGQRSTQKSKSTIRAYGSELGGLGQVGLGQWSTRWRGADEATLLTWLADMPADMAFFDVNKWRHGWQHHRFRSVASVWLFHRCKEEKPKTQVAHETAIESHISFIGRSVVNMAYRTAHMANGWATHEEIVAVRGKDPKT